MEGVSVCLINISACKHSVWTCSVGCIAVLSVSKQYSLCTRTYTRTPVVTCKHNAKHFVMQASTYTHVAVHISVLVVVK
jgi:hypothetical protein